MTCNYSARICNRLTRQHAGTPVEDSFSREQSRLLAYLYEFADIARGYLMPGTERWRYQSYEELLLEHGRWFPVIGQPNWYSLDSGVAVSSANQLMQRALTDGMIYCEGVAVVPGSHPVERSWLVDPASSFAALPGKPALPTLLFGVPFSREFIQSRSGLQGGIFQSDLVTHRPLLVYGLPHMAVRQPHHK